MFFSFNIEKPIKKIFTFALIAFASGAVMSAITIKKDHYESDSDNTDYYNELMEWIGVLHTKVTFGTSKYLNGIKIFIRNLAKF